MEDISIQIHPERIITGRHHSIAVVKDKIQELKNKYLVEYAFSKADELASVVPSQCSENCPIYDSCDRERANKICERELESFNRSFYSYLAELATIDILEMRCYDLISREGLQQEIVVAVNSRDVPIYGKQQHTGVNILAILWKRRSAVKQELSATREQKAKIAAEMSGKMTVAELMSEVTARMRERRAIDVEVIESE